MNIHKRVRDGEAQFAHLPLHKLAWVWDEKDNHSLGAVGAHLSQFTYRIHLHFRNGKEHVIRFTESDLKQGRDRRDAILQTLRERCPQASFDDYSLRRRRQWKRDVRQWRKMGL